MRRKRLIRQLGLSYVWVTVAAVVLVGLSGSHMVQDYYLEQTAEDLQARARLCRPQIVSLLEQGDRAGVDAFCKELGRATATRITAILPSGEVVGDTEENPANMDNHAQRPEVVEARQGKVGRQTRYSMTLQQKLMYVAVPVEQRGELALVVRTSIPVTEVEKMLGTLRRRILVAALVAGVLAVALSLWFSARLSGPLSELEAGAERFALGQLEHRLAGSSFEEIAALAEAMNRMAGQLQERFQTIVRQQNELEAVLTSMQEGVLAVDNRGTVINVNHACAAILGAEPEELKGRLVHEVIRKPDLLEFVESSILSEESMERDIQIRGAEDRWLHAHSMALCDAKQRKIGALVVMYDVTRLRRLENVRRDFVANVSHELRTPITSIKGFVETLLDGALEDTENASRFLEIVLRQVNRLDAIINDLLTLSRVERGNEPISRLEPGRVGETLKAAVEMCEKKASEKQIRIELRCDPDATAKINAPLLEQAVVNLVDNAVKYSEPGKTVRVSAERAGVELVIRVQDEGCGIEPKHLPRLFERFYRVDKARSRELGGTGLGLAIVRHIALAHGGDVEVQSAVGRGSVFSIRLCAADREADLVGRQP